MTHPARTWILAFYLLLAALLDAPAARSAGEGELPQRLIAFRGAELRTVAGDVIAHGTLVVQGAKITAVGAVDGVAIPPAAEVVDATGLVIIPGLVDTHSHVGIVGRPALRMNVDGNETSGPLQSELRALDAIWPEDPGIRMALAGGVTTVNIMPGSANMVGGQTAYVKLRGSTVDEMLIHRDGVRGGMKMANGENPKRTHGAKRAPGTRMAGIALQRGLFQRALEYEAKLDKHRGKLARGEESDPPTRDLQLEPMIEVLAGERTVHHHTHRADDIMSVLRVREEFGFDLVLQHATEAYKVADQLAVAGVPASIIIVDSPGGKPEFADYSIENGALLERAGVRVAIHTDDPVTDSRLFLRCAAMAVRGGMSEAGALRALTLEPARMLRLDERLGSLEPGKDADFVVLSGDPFSVYTHVLETWIEGVRVFDRSDTAQRGYAVGGYAVRAEVQP